MPILDVELPACRVADVTTTHVGGDLIVFNRSAGTIHTLNEVTARVWQTLETARPLQDVMMETGLSQDAVLVAATLLADAGLLTKPLTPQSRARTSRRDLLRMFGAGGAIAAPTLVSVTAATAAAAASCQDECGASGSVGISLLAPITDPLTLGTSSCSEQCGTCFPQAVVSVTVASSTISSAILAVDYVGECRTNGSGAYETLNTLAINWLPNVSCTNVLANVRDGLCRVYNVSGCCPFTSP